MNKINIFFSIFFPKKAFRTLEQKTSIVVYETFYACSQ